MNLKEMEEAARMTKVGLIVILNIIIFGVGTTYVVSGQGDLITELKFASFMVIIQILLAFALDVWIYPKKWKGRIKKHLLRKS